MNAIKAWFYPGSGMGVRFVYPEDEAATIAAACKEPVPETHGKVNVGQANSEKIYLITPERQEEEYTPNQLTKPDQADTNGFDAAAAPSSPDHDSQPH